MDACYSVNSLLGFLVMFLTTISPSCAYIPSQLKEPSFLSDSMLRDLLDQTLGNKQYLGPADVAAAVDEASYIDPLLLPADEVSPRLAMLVRAANGDLSGQPKPQQRLQQAEQLDYDSLLMSANARPSLRDQEYAHQSTLWGHHFVSGGHGEGHGPVRTFGDDLAAEIGAQQQQQQQQQHHRIGEFDDDGLLMSDQQQQSASSSSSSSSSTSSLAAASAAKAAASAYRQTHLPQIKSDATLPAYCNPPNPCPVGYSAANGCQMEFENTAAYSREYQAAQECMCDNEHMFMCQQEPSQTRRMDAYLNLPFAPQQQQQQLSQAAEQGHDDEEVHEHKNLVAKKFHPSSSQNEQRSVAPRQFNPYMEGEKLPVAAKKGIRSY